MPLVRLLGHSYYGALLREGIEIFEIDHEQGGYGQGRVDVIMTNPPFGREEEKGI